MRSIILVFNSVLLTLVCSASMAKESLFNGKDFSGWGMSIQNNTSGTQAQDIWSVTAGGEIYANGSKKLQSGLYTLRDDYQNYELSFEYQFTENHPVLDSGVWIHGGRDFIESGGAYPASIQVQLRTGHEGDLLLRSMNLLPEQGCKTGSDAGKPDARILRRKDPQVAKYGQWNQVRVISEVTSGQGSTISVWINDVLVNKGVYASHDMGRITLQHEGWAVKFRNINIEDYRGNHNDVDTSCLAPSQPAPKPTALPQPTAMPEPLPSSVPTSAPNDRTALFNGTDFTGWAKSIQNNNQGITGDDIWSVTEAGEIFANGSQKIQSGLYSLRDDYKNYDFSFEYQYTENKPVLDSGVWIHGSRDLVESGGAYPASIQVQLRTGGEGDLLLRSMSLLAEPGCVLGWDGRKKDARIIRREDPKAFKFGQWNNVRIISEVTPEQGSTISVWINGVLVNKGIYASHDMGRITLQHEGWGIKFRNLSMNDYRGQHNQRDTSCLAEPSPLPTPVTSFKPMPTMSPAPTLSPRPLPTISPTILPTPSTEPMPSTRPSPLPSANPVPTMPPSAAAKPLFNGVNFNGFGFSIEKRKGRIQGIQGRDIWSYTDKGEIFADGDKPRHAFRTAQSGLYTISQDHGNYELSFDYMYTQNKPNANSGVWLLGGRDFIDTDGAFPASIEVQLRRGFEGDLLLKQLELEPEFEWVLDNPGLGRDTGRLKRRYNPNAAPYGQWNSVKIVAEVTPEQGSTISVWINGRFVNKGIHAGRDKGRIVFQAEGADMLFRNVMIRPLK